MAHAGVAAFVTGKVDGLACFAARAAGSASARMASEMRQGMGTRNEPATPDCARRAAGTLALLASRCRSDEPIAMARAAIHLASPGDRRIVRMLTSAIA
jgi:hypothetical protein